MPNIVVLGAGVSGLTSALLLAREKKHAITVVAKHMPGDYDIEYTSPWAGANYMPMADDAHSRWERETWPELKRLAAEVPEAGIHFQKALVLRREKELDQLPQKRMSDTLFEQNPWFTSLFDDYHHWDKSDLPEGMASASEWTSLCINVALYLPWLLGQCRALGVVFKRANLKHISEAAALSHTAAPADIVINASGLLASKLGGVLDKDVVPIRGQIVIVRNELEHMITVSGSDDGDEEITYTMMRASGGGTVLGGTYQLGNWDPNPDLNQAMRIMSRVVKYHPQLKGKRVEDLDIIRHAVGLRPYRASGVRIEGEVIDGVRVVHNYGHSGWGYQGSYGCTRRVLELVNEMLAEKGVGEVTVDK